MILKGSIRYNTVLKFVYTVNIGMVYVVSISSPTARGKPKRKTAWTKSNLWGGRKTTLLHSTVLLLLNHLERGKRSDLPSERLSGDLEPKGNRRRRRGRGEVEYGRNCSRRAETALRETSPSPPRPRVNERERETRAREFTAASRMLPPR